MYVAATGAPGRKRVEIHRRIFWTERSRSPLHVEELVVAEAFAERRAQRQTETRMACGANRPAERTPRAPSNTARQALQPEPPAQCHSPFVCSPLKWRWKSVRPSSGRIGAGGEVDVGVEECGKGQRILAPNSSAYRIYCKHHLGVQGRSERTDVPRAQVGMVSA